jgi:STELLO glycosyltransferase-like protein
MKSIVITTIFPPTQAVRDFSTMRNARLIVVGDRKTPEDWFCENTHFISVNAQVECAPKLSAALPWNHYCRKMIGYIEAIRLDSECIVDTDDDNIPNSDWSFPEAEGLFETTDQSAKFVNIYKTFTDKPIWPRGFPLEYILQPESEPARAPARKIKVGIWQGLADGDPDVDAIYRLTNNEQCIFNKREPLVLGRGNFCPFNSQNTLFFRDVFPLLYLPAFVTFRFTDILRGLIAQPILWEAGYHLGFTAPTVIQQRNPHDYLQDFELEVPCYLLVNKVADIVSGAVRSSASICDNLFNAYDALLAREVVKREELSIVTAWLEELGR